MLINTLESPSDDMSGDMLDAGVFPPADFPPLALLYKHSPICGISFRAMTEVETFARENPDVPVYIIDVLTQRSLSHQVSAKLGVRHESPQVILVRDGKAIWSRSGMRIRLDVIEYAVGDGTGRR